MRYPGVLVAAVVLCSCAVLVTPESLQMPTARTTLLPEPPFDGQPVPQVRAGYAAPPPWPPGAEPLEVTFDPPMVLQLHEHHTAVVEVWARAEQLRDRLVKAHSSDTVVATVYPEVLNFSPYNATHHNTSLEVRGHFLGYNYIYLRGYEGSLNASSTENVSGALSQSSGLPVSVIRTPGWLDRAFLYSVILLVSLIYVNFGCALDWTVIRATLRRPVGPAIGFCSQFLFMPLISFGLGRLLFPDQIALQLGMFFTGCAPGGGASNMWTVALHGNLDLSITMTSISTFAAFGMIPLWVFSLGRVIFMEGRLGVPYGKISTVAVGLIVPLLLGTLIKFYLPKVARTMVRALKPFAVFLLVFIIAFGTVTNLFVFYLMDWKILCGSLSIPLLGYVFGGVVARLLGQKDVDVIAIAVETGVQNTGISIYLLRFALEQPEADLAQVCPVAVALMTPIPLTLLALCLYLKRRRQASLKQGVERVPSTEVTTPNMDGSEHEQVSSLRYLNGDSNKI